MIRPAPAGLSGGMASFKAWLAQMHFPARPGLAIFRRMKNWSAIILLVVLYVASSGCAGNNRTSDASSDFWARTIVSSIIDSLIPGSSVSDEPLEPFDPHSLQ